MTRFKKKSNGGVKVTRYEGQTVVAGDITVEVVEIRGNQVRLAFRAAREILILRGELLDKNEAQASPVGTP